MNKVRLHTEHPVATHSPDHLQAEHSGSGNDNSTNPLFLAKLFSLMGGADFALLDLGCAGGGFVKSVLDAGAFAVGLEGSDYSKGLARAEWATAPDNLFTCDVTKPFLLTRDEPDHLLRFDVVTAWEVMEHFSEAELPGVIANVLAHLAPRGVWVMSVSTEVDNNFHRCVHRMDWWLAAFAAAGLTHRPAVRARFDPDFVRGPLATPWAIQAPGSFHLVLMREGVPDL